MEKKSIRFGVVGPGAIGRFHSTAIMQAAGTELVSILGRDVAKTETFAKEFGVKAYTDPQAFLTSDNLGAITIASPSGAHQDIAVLAAEKKINILCEKPLEVTGARSNIIIEACRKNGVQLGVIFQGRFEPCTLLAKDAIKAGRLGRILFASCQMRWARSQAYYDSAPWRGTWALDGGGCLMNQAIHSIDLLLHLAGDPLAVAAFRGISTHQRIEVEDNFCASVRYANGAVGTIEASTSCEPGLPRKIEISGENGTICIEGNRIVRWEFKEMISGDEDIVQSFEIPEEGLGGASDPMAIDVTGHKRVVDDFVTSLHEKRAPRVSGEEGKRSVDFICAAYKSMEQNGAVVPIDARL